MNIIDLIFPIKCLNCKKPGKYICASCINKVPPAGWNKEKVYSLWKYKGVIRKAIISFKYKHATEVAKELILYMLDELDKRKNIFNKETVSLPVPLYWYKQNTRGFNQSEMIGKAIAEHYSCKFIPDLIIRKRHTKAQVELKGAERKENIKGVFEFNNGYKCKIDSNCSLIIVDDVWTTGSTIKEIAKVLKNQGFKNVLGLTVAN